MAMVHSVSMATISRKARMDSCGVEFLLTRHLMDGFGTAARSLSRTARPDQTARTATRTNGLRCARAHAATKRHPAIAEPAHGLPRGVTSHLSAKRKRARPPQLKLPELR